MARQALGFAGTKILPPRVLTGMLVRDALAQCSQNDAVGAATALNLQRAGICLQCGDPAQSAQSLCDGLWTSCGFAANRCRRALQVAALLQRLSDSPVAQALDAAQWAMLASVVPMRGAVAEPANPPATPCRPARVEPI